jgi:glucosamine-6-phosphate deaminase
MNILVAHNYTELSQHAAQLIAEKIKDNPRTALGLATGSTPLGLYRELANRVNQHVLDVQHITTFNLDEYVGLAPDHPQSYHCFMHTYFLNHVLIAKDRIFIPNGCAENLDHECLSYENSINNCGGIDIQILGIGRDGHIGFNEPGSSAHSRTRIVPLDTITIHDNARFFANDTTQVPTHAITMGIATILAAREIILLANGAHKADIIYRTLYGPITEQIPASFLQQHPNVTVILDQEAAAMLPKKPLLA